MGNLNDFSCLVCSRMLLGTSLKIDLRCFSAFRSLSSSCATLETFVFKSSKLSPPCSRIRRSKLPIFARFHFHSKIIIFSLWVFVNFCDRSGKRSLIRKESRNRSLTFFDEYCPGEASGHWSSRKNVSQEASGALFELIRQMAKVISRQKK